MYSGGNPLFLLGLGFGVIGGGLIYFYINKKTRTQQEIKKKDDKVRDVNLTNESSYSWELEWEDVTRTDMNTTSDTNSFSMKSQIDSSEIEFKPNPNPNHIGIQEKSAFCEIRVPKTYLKLLNGPNGIKNIEKETGTRIIGIREELVDGGDYKYNISGLPEDVSRAEIKIQTLIKSQPLTHTVEIIVPEYAIGRIIGFGGENVKHIQIITNTEIHVPRIQDYIQSDKDFTDDDYEPPNYTNYTRIIQINGTEEGILAAKLQIQNIVKDESK